MVRDGLTEEYANITIIGVGEMQRKWKKEALGELESNIFVDMFCAKLIILFLSWYGMCVLFILNENYKLLYLGCNWELLSNRWYNENGMDVGNAQVLIIIKLEGDDMPDQGRYTLHEMLGGWGRVVCVYCIWW